MIFLSDQDYSWKPSAISACKQAHNLLTEERRFAKKKKKSILTNAGLKRSDWSEFNHIFILLSKKQVICIFFQL